MRMGMLLGLLAIAAVCEAKVLCATRNGTVKLRDVCRPRESLATSVAHLTIPESTGVGALIVRDANGTFIGFVTQANSSGYSDVVASIDGVHVLLRLNAGEFESSEELRWYEAIDCTGQAYASLATDAGSLFGRGVFEHGLIFYVRGAKEPKTILAYFQPGTAEWCSSAGGAFTAPGFCCLRTDRPLQMNLAPVTEVSLSLTAPFWVEGP